MSFGNRSTAKVIKYKEPVEYVFTTSPKTSANTANLVGLTLIGLLLSAFGTLWFAMPFTTPAPRVHYNIRDLAQSDLASGMLPEVQRKTGKKYLLDFSIIRPQSGAGKGEVTEILKQNCMPYKGYPPRATLKRAHTVFARATNYLICATKTELARLCMASHRKRLVAQLLQYRALRQNLFAIERVRSAMLRNPMARVFNDIAQKIDGGPQRNYNPKIGKKIDARLARNLRVLVQSGYLSASDFGFLGLFLPAEYAPYLADGVVGQSRCS